MEKIKEKVLVDSVQLLQIGIDSVNYKLTEYICPLCGEKIISLYLDDIICYGGLSSVRTKKGGLLEGCNKCIAQLFAKTYIKKED